MTSTINRINRINTVISENIDALIFILNEKFVCEYVNFKDIKGVFHIHDFIHPKDSKTLTKFIKNAFNLGKDTTESRIKSDSDDYRWYEIVGKQIVEEDKKKLILICHDISKYKYYEKEFKQSQIRYSQLADSLPEIKYWKLIQSKEGIAAVQKAGEMLELVINNIPQLIYWKDKALVFMGSNSNFAKVNGFEKPTSIIGRKGNELDWIRDKNAYIDDCERKVMTRNTPEFNVIEPLITSEGNQAWFEINRIPLLDAKDKVVGILVT
ncbi:MAG: PAS domain-containing protein, partial [Candidatus Lokiarchaeota archaeon]|nr:PAS domain-containing protein [Candidatus Lokiarchaeota archaeon]